jgi:ABC-type sugar transport system substrate-binding protein
MKKYLSLAIAVLMIVSVMSACTSNKTAKTTKIKIGLSMCDLDSQFWVANTNAVKAEAKKQNMDLVVEVANDDTQKQNQQVESLITAKAQAIIIAPQDSTTIVSAIKDCNTANIPVIMDNRAAGPGAIVAASVNADSVSMVKNEMDWIEKKAVASNTVYNCLELIGSLGDQNAIARKTGFEASVAKYPNTFKLVASVPTDWQASEALTGTQNALQAHKDINFLFSASDALMPAASSALQQAGKWFKAGQPGHVTILSFDGAASTIADIKSGYIDSVEVQDAVKEGIAPVDTALKLIKHETVSSSQIDPGFQVDSDNISTSTFAGY